MPEQKGSNLQLLVSLPTSFAGSLTANFAACMQSLRLITDSEAWME
jgi:hypothetical protein